MAERMIRKITFIKCRSEGRDFYLLFFYLSLRPKTEFKNVYYYDVIISVLPCYMMSCN